MIQATTQTVSHTLTQFRARREGPEATVQDFVVSNIPRLFSPGENTWTGASVPLGAGIPDLVVVSYNPEVFALADVDLPDTHILAYLRAVGKARLDTIAERMGRSRSQLHDRLYHLVDAEAVDSSENLFSLAPNWRAILPEIITVEVKIANWQKALEQAARNRIFAHISYIAVPEKVAERVRSESLLCSLGIGLISVTEDGTTTTVKRPRRGNPSVWTYYYQLASMLARSLPN